MKTSHTLAIVVALFGAVVLLPMARASDNAPEPTRAPTARPAADKLGQARALIAARQWGPALEELRRVDDARSADWNNLMGFTLRKGAAPDLVASEKYYDAALKIDPQHRDTLEYSGELYLMKGELPRAQARLSTLAAVCASNCPQYADLHAAIDRYVANGNKYVTTGW